MVDNHKSNQGQDYTPEAWCPISARFSNMADKGFPNVDNIKVKVLGGKEGRYDLKKLPKQVHSKKKNKPVRKKWKKLNSFEPPCISDTAQSSSDSFEGKNGHYNCDKTRFEVEEPSTDTFQVRDLVDYSIIRSTT